MGEPLPVLGGLGVRARTGIIGLSLLLAGACASPFPSFRELDAGASTEAGQALEILAAWRSPTRLLERVTMTRWGGELVLSVYVAAESPGEVRFAGVSDLGATLFSVVATGASIEVLHESPGFTAEFLREEFIPDQMAALLRPPVDDATLVSTEAGRPAVHFKVGVGEALLYLGNRSEPSLVRGVDGELHSTIAWIVDDLEASPAPPESILITNRVADYHARLELAPWN